MHSPLAQCSVCRIAQRGMHAFFRENRAILSDLGPQNLLGATCVCGIIRSMNPPETLQLAVEAEIAREIINLVPNWYEAQYGPERYPIPVGEHTEYFYDHYKLSPYLEAFLATISSRTRELPLHHFINLPRLIDVLLESCAVEWLRIHSSATDWVRLVKYLDAVARRTSENQPIGVNLIVREGRGTEDITEPTVQKFLDRLASSHLSYFTVDSDLRLIDYGEVAWEQIQSSTSPKFHPEFLHPIHSVMSPTDISAHLTTQGDLIIMGKTGLLAARRHQKWKLYDGQSFVSSLSQCLGSRHVGNNLLEVIFDLSFQRAGALLVYDPNHCIRDHILNAESVVSSKWRRNGESTRQECGQALIERLLADTAIGEEAGSLERKRRLMEMACADGAVVFDDHSLLAVGALIKSHPSVGNQLGARTTAARSAYLWGAHPIKVSSDGDVTVYFKSRNGDNECDAEMHIL